nr:DUF2270 domain-containing protein [Haladaptatus cibarius]
MTDGETRDYDPGARENRGIGRELAEGNTELRSALAHFYRGEMDRTNTWRQRLNQTTYWAITLMAAILTWAFSSRENPHYLLLIEMLVVTAFLGMEARRYRGYDIWRSRIRTLQENVFSPALNPATDVETIDWRDDLSEDVRRPTPKISIVAALAHRLHRVYLPLLSLILVAWVVRVTTFEVTETQESGQSTAPPSYQPSLSSTLDCWSSRSGRGRTT